METEKTWIPSNLWIYHKMKALAQRHYIDAEKVGIEGTKIAYIECKIKSCFYYEGMCKNSAPIFHSLKGCLSYDKNKLT